MSGAVFLGYASQDAAAGLRICEALRAAGIEVWFDQSELRGGDAWDAKIRRPYHPFPLSNWWFTPIPANLLLGEHDTAMQLMCEAAMTPEGRNLLRACRRLDPRMAPWRDEPEINALLAEPPAAGAAAK
jgi:hypothetical protein